MTMTTDARVQEIRARLEAATSGPWQPWPDGTEESVESVSVGRFVCHLNSNMRQFREDARFISHAREDVPYLLARLDALTAERDVLRVERDIARRVEQESSAAADAWQAEIEQVKAERDALAARLAAAESALVAYADLIDYKPFMVFERAFNSIVDNESAPSDPDERERWLIRQAWVSAMNVAVDTLDARAALAAASEGE